MLRIHAKAVVAAMRADPVARHGAPMNAFPSRPMRKHGPATGAASDASIKLTVAVVDPGAYPDPAIRYRIDN